MNIFWSLLGDFKAWKRGETRVAPRECTGRVFSPKVQLKAGGHTARAKGTLTLNRRVYRDATDTWETLPELRTEQ